MTRRVLVAGVGNVFLADDGFGVEVVRHIDPTALPPGVVVADYGIRGVHLAYELLDDRYDALVIVDAVPIEGPPGTLAVIEADTARARDVVPAVDGHGMDPVAVLDLVTALGGGLRRALVVGCRPAVIEERMGLSPEVSAAVPAAAELAVRVAREEVLADA